MGTRASIILKDESATLFFYRHSDGYPECTGADLTAFVAEYKSGAMRTNPIQSAGWLIVRGHNEYLRPFGDDKDFKEFTGKPTAEGFSGWKVGAYEPTDSIHSDVEYVYVIDLKKMTLDCRQPTSGFWDKPTLKNTEPCAEFKTVRFGLKVVT